MLYRLDLATIPRNDAHYDTAPIQPLTVIKVWGDLKYFARDCILKYCFRARNYTINDEQFKKSLFKALVYCHECGVDYVEITNRASTEFNLGVIIQHLTDFQFASVARIITRLLFDTGILVSSSEYETILVLKENENVL